MDYEPAKPHYTLTLAGKEYELEGSFELIEACENALKKHISAIGNQCLEGLPATDMCKLLYAVLNTCGHRVSMKDLREILWDKVGLDSPEYAAVGLHVFAFIRIVVARPADREETAKTMGEFLAGMKTRISSPGENTANSA